MIIDFRQQVFVPLGRTAADTAACRKIVEKPIRVKHQML